MTAWFDPQTAGADEILAYAKHLRGKTLRELLPASGALKEGSAGDKGAFGQYVERIFRLPRSNAQRPDFEHAGVELKVVPLRDGTKEIRAKERTSVTMIDYTTLPRERWSDATARKKLQSILFVFYVHREGVDVLDLKIEDCIFWSPDEALLPQLEHDWSIVRQKVIDGEAHLISESDGRVLGAATKGAGGGRTVPQPFNPSVGAKRRAWALKPSLTSWILTDARRPQGVASISVASALGLPPASDFESAVLKRLSRFSGRTVKDVASELGVKLSVGKSGAALIVRRAVGILDDRALIREFEERGVEVKTVPLSPEGKPYEAMSFPAFRYKQVILEEWEDSDLLTRLQRLLIIPLMRKTRKAPTADAIWGRPFFWSPSAEELREIRQEWEGFLRQIREGRAASLKGYSRTRFIHVRPKGLDGTDTDDAPLCGPVVKKAFWLNPAFVQRIVAENDGLQGVR